ncbi:MAG: hypothetical protein R3F11_30335 [Verrucomicrobiales bacterium]
MVVHRQGEGDLALAGGTAWVSDAPWLRCRRASFATSGKSRSWTMPAPGSNPASFATADGYMQRRGSGATSPNAAAFAALAPSAS